jgi:predicted O-methyltransferase YrrM
MAFLASISAQASRLGAKNIAALLCLAVVLILVLGGLEMAAPRLGIITGLVLVIVLCLALAKIIMSRISEAERNSRMDSLQTEYLMALYRILEMDRDLPKMRGWAISPDFGHYLAQTMLDRKPETVVELGSGVSSLIISRCMTMNGGGHLYSIDHDAGFAGKTEKMLAEYGLKDRVTLCVAELARQDIRGKECLWYDLGSIPELDQIDLLVIDGPPGHLDKEIRYPAIPVFCDRHIDGGIALVDDYDRDCERSIASKWLNEYSGYSQQEMETEKGLLVLKKTARN